MKPMVCTIDDALKEMAWAMLGQRLGDDKEVVILGRILRWRGDGLLLQANPKRVSKLDEGIGFTLASKPVFSPIEKSVRRDVDGGGVGRNQLSFSYLGDSVINYNIRVSLPIRQLTGPIRAVLIQIILKNFKIGKK